MNILMVGTPSTTDVTGNHKSPAVTAGSITLSLLGIGAFALMMVIGMCYFYYLDKKTVPCLNKCSGKKLFI